MSEILTIYGGMIQGQDHVNDNIDQVFTLDLDVDEEYVSLNSHEVLNHNNKTLEEVAKEIVESYNKKYGEENE